MRKDERRKCCICRGRFEDADLIDWIKNDEHFQVVPLMCPKCYKWVRAPYEGYSETKQPNV